SDRTAYVNIISPDFFRTYGTRLLAGRDFTDADTAGSAPVAIVNGTFARKYFGAGSPIGRRVIQSGWIGRPPVTREIVGYVQDAVYRNLRLAVPPTIYVPRAQ